MSIYGQRINPRAHRHPPQAGWTLLKQSSIFSFAISQLLQKVQGEKLKFWSRFLNSR